jgi:hypothetical protein
MLKRLPLILSCSALLFAGPLACAYAQDAEDAPAPESAEKIAEDKDDVEWQPGSGLESITTEEEMAALLKNAESGDAQAQYDYGVARMRGYLVEKDDKIAIEWMRKAADQDIELALNNMGYANLRGFGVETNAEESVSWFKRSAAKGNHVAQYELGHAYMEGVGADEEPEVGVKWLEKAANGGITAAQFELAKAYFDGNGVKQDFIESFAWGHLASRHYPDAGELIADLHMELDPKQYKKAKRHATKLKLEVDAKLAADEK